MMMDNAGWMLLMMLCVIFFWYYFIYIEHSNMNIEHGILNLLFFSLKKKMSGDAGESNLP